MQSPYQSFEDYSKCTNYNEYHRQVIIIIIINIIIIISLLVSF